MIEPGLEDTGSLVVSGYLHVEGNYADLGSTLEGSVALVLSYHESGSVRQMIVNASKEAVEYLWAEGSDNPLLAFPKMSLSADNTLTLYNASGIATITLSAASGEIYAPGGIRLGDNTLLEGAHSLCSTALYNALGQVVAEVDANGVINFANGITIGTSSGAVLNEGRMGYLNGVLGKLGYSDNLSTPVSTDVLQVMDAESSVVVGDAAGNRYVAGVFEGNAVRLGNIALSTVSGSDSTAFVAKINPDGSLAWEMVGASPMGATATSLLMLRAACMSQALLTMLGT